jgi:ketosteroid isomerase-like protein
MLVWLVLMLTTFPAAPQDAFTLRCDIQAWYDELAQTVLQSRTPSDIDMVHSVFETDDVSFVDADGHRHDWADARARMLQTLQAPIPDQLRLVLRDVKTTPGGAVAVVRWVTLRTSADSEGRYGHAGANHAIATVVTYRDTLVQIDTSWKLKMREQIGAPETLVDKLPHDVESSLCGS